MKIPPEDTQWVRVPLAKGCYLLLLRTEYERALGRAKAERRRLANERRKRGEGNILDALEE